jgi:putative endonuclease
MKFGHHYFVYILECSDKSYYTGVTNNLIARLGQHQDGDITTCYTFKRRPVVLKYSTHLIDIKQAIAWEKQIKGWSRKKKEALFTEDWETIIKLARNYTQYPPDSALNLTD